MSLFKRIADILRGRAAPPPKTREPEAPPPPAQRDPEEIKAIYSGPAEFKIDDPTASDDSSPEMLEYESVDPRELVGRASGVPDPVPPGQARTEKRKLQSAFDDIKEGSAGKEKIGEREWQAQAEKPEKPPSRGR